MIATIQPGRAAGRVRAPASKSMTHRILIAGALSAHSLIKGVEFSDDIKATLACLAALGADIHCEGSQVEIGGFCPEHPVVRPLLPCGESGSTLRFMIPLCLLTGQKIVLKGTERLMQRSLAVYEELCASQGILFCREKDRVGVQGRLTPGNYMVRGNISSQFISGLFFALPTLGADSYLTITDGLESASYLDMTVKALADFGVRIKKTDEHTFFIKGNQTYKNRELTVEGDYSNAAFFEALNVLGGNVAISGLRTKTWQGDAVCKEHLEALKRGKAQIDLTDCPDLGPVLMAVAAAHHGAVFTGTRRLKIKESDRGAAMAEELAKFGISTQVEENRIIVQSGILQKPRQPLDGHNDHRVVMSLAVLCTLTGGEIYGAQAVAKSFPDFFERLSSLGIQISLQ